MRTVAMRLQEAVNNVCPALGVSIGTMGLSASVDITFDPAATGAQQAAAQNAVATFDWSGTAHAAWELLKDRADATTDLSDLTAPNKLLRALLLTLLDELNALREWLVSFKAATAAATSLTNLQTRVAALPDMPDRTAAQARTAIGNKISSGAADS
jgi:hypothetical protein